jgi:DNA-binding transcriptional LysR family regulator
MIDESPRAMSAVVELPGKLAPSLPQLLSRLRYRHLSLLVALDEYRNLHRAAKVVHLAQPSASKLVHDLELLLGSAIFERLPTGMQPTPFGMIVIAFAHRALAELKRFATDMDDRRSGRRGELLVGTLMDAVPEVVGHALADITRRRPLLSVRLFGESGDAIITRLIEGHIDVAVGYFDSALEHGELNYQWIGSEELCVVVRQDHPLSQESRPSPAALERAQWICQRLTRCAREDMDQDFRRVGLKAPASVVDSSSLGATLNLLLSSDAVTILPESIVRNYLRAGALVRLRVTIGDHDINYGILSRIGESPSPAATEFIELLRQHGQGAGRRTHSAELTRGAIISPRSIGHLAPSVR